MLIQVLNGIVYGGLLYLLAVGLVLIFGLREVVNFAHGALFMMGAYIGFSVAAAGFWWGGLARLGGGDGDCRLCAGRDGVSLAAQAGPHGNGSRYFRFASHSRNRRHHDLGKGLSAIPVPALLSGTVDIEGSPFPIYRLFVIGVSFAVAMLLTAWLRLTRTGLYMRAASTDARITSIQGINIDRLSLIVVGLGTALAGLSGVVAGPLLTLSPTMGNYILIDSFIVVVIGGLGSFAGAFAAALLIGQIHNFGAIYLPWAATILPFLLMVAS